MRHKICGSVIKLNSNTQCDKILYLDTSKYLDNIVPENPILQIYPPNWNTFYSIAYNMNATTVITPDHINQECLPSGVYHLIQSVKPNNKVKFETCFLWACKEEQSIAELACSFIEACDEDRLEDILNIKLSLSVAKDLVSSGKVKEGTILFNIVLKKIKSLDQKLNCDVC